MASSQLWVAMPVPPSLQPEKPPGLGPLSFHLPHSVVEPQWLEGVRGFRTAALSEACPPRPNPGTDCKLVLSADHGGVSMILPWAASASCLSRPHPWGLSGSQVPTGSQWLSQFGMSMSFA